MLHSEVTEKSAEAPDKTLVVHTSEGDATFLDMVLRAARDPSVDVQKMVALTEMLAMRDARDAERAFSDAMNACQAEMRPVSQNASNPQTRSKYASYAALDNALRPIYARHGFALTFDTGDGAPEGCVRVVCKVSHRTGHAERPHLDMPNDGKGAKGGDVMTKTHATMSAVTYARRGLLKMVFNIAEVEYDDDGNGAGEFITSEQAIELETMLKNTKSNVQRFLKFMGVDGLLDIPANQFQKAKHALDQKGQNNNEG